MAEQTQNAAENASIKSTDTSTGNEVTQAAARVLTPDGSDREEAFKHRLAREMEKARKAWEQELEAEKKKAGMAEAERLKVEKLELEAKLAEAKHAASAAEQRRAATEALLEAGVDPKKVSRATALYLAEVRENEALEPKTWIQSWPEFIAVPDAAGTGFRRAIGNTLTQAEIDRMTPQELNQNWERVQAFYRSKR